MVKKVICFALGGHIATQNASFKHLVEILEPRDYRFYGAKDGFDAFNTGETYELDSKEIPENFAGFVAGAGRFSLLYKNGKVDYEKIQRAKDFLQKGKFDIVVGSGGDDHGKQINILSRELKAIVQGYVINKTMDNDLGGIDGKEQAPYTDFTNGYCTAVEIGSKFVKNHFSGAWTNNMPYLIGHFGRETNWTGIAIAYWGFADRIVFGELPKEHQGHSIEKLHELILESQKRNEEKYGRRFAMIIVPEGTRISGLQHVSPDLVDAYGHHKLNPESLVIELKKELEKRFKMKTQTAGITYEMRNFPPTRTDLHFARISAQAIAGAILRGENRVESTLKINGDNLEDIKASVAPIEKVSEKRYCSYYEEKNHPFIDKETFEVTDEIERYYRALFGKRKNLSDLLPSKPSLFNVFV